VGYGQRLTAAKRAALLRKRLQRGLYDRASATQDVSGAYAKILRLILRAGTSMKISKEDVLKVAALANLELSDAEVDTFRGHLDDILTYIDKLNEIDTSGVEPLTQVVAAAEDDSALRDDVVVRADVITEVLQGAPDPEAPYFRVPRVIEK